MSKFCSRSFFFAIITLKKFFLEENEKKKHFAFCTIWWGITIRNKSRHPLSLRIFLFLAQYLHSIYIMIHFKRRINDGSTAFQKLAKSEEEDVVGNYFKPIRASRLMAQAQETQRGKGNLNLDFT